MHNACDGRFKDGKLNKFAWYVCPNGGAPVSGAPTLDTSMGVDDSFTVGTQTTTKLHTKSKRKHKAFTHSTCTASQQLIYTYVHN